MVVLKLNVRDKMKTSSNFVCFIQEKYDGNLCDALCNPHNIYNIRCYNLQKNAIVYKFDDLTDYMQMCSGTNFWLCRHLTFIDASISSLNIFDLQNPFFGCVLEIRLKPFIGNECDSEKKRQKFASFNIYSRMQINLMLSCVGKQ